MTVHDSFDRELSAWLEHGAGSAAPDYLDETLAAIDNLDQRPSWRYPGRWLPLERAGGPLRTAPTLGVLALLALLLLGLAVVLTAGRPPGVPVTVPPPYGIAAPGLIAFDADGRIMLAEPDLRSMHPLIASDEPQVGATFSRDGTRVAFWQENGSGIENGAAKTVSELWVTGADGSEPVLLTPDDVFTAAPYAPAAAWSPDGSSLAFTDKMDHLYVVPTDGSAPPRIIAEGPGLKQTPAWSPDGSLIAFLDGTLTMAAVYVVHPDGTGLEQVSGNTAGAETGLLPNWSPDGRSLLYAVDLTDPAAPEPIEPPKAPAPHAIVIARRESAGWAERIVIDRTSTLVATFSNDGSRIAFVQSRPGTWQGDLQVVDLDGGEPRQLSDRPVNLSQPCWSPDDRTIGVITGPVPAGSLPPFGWPAQVQTLFPVDGGAVREIFAGTVTGVLACSWQRLAP